MVSAEQVTVHRYIRGFQQTGVAIWGLLQLGLSSFRGYIRGPYSDHILGSPHVHDQALTCPPEAAGSSDLGNGLLS